MYKIDGHNHPDFLNMSFSDMLADMKKNGISKTCLATWENPWIENYPSNMTICPSPLSGNVPVPFERVLAYYEKAPDKFIMGYAPDPRKFDAVYKMKSAVDTYGVKMCSEVKFRMMYDNPDAVDLFRFCGDCGVPVTLHFDNPGASLADPGMLWKHYWYGGDILTLERLLELCPKTNFLAHAPGFWNALSNSDEWKTVSYPSGPVIPGGHIERLLGKFNNLYLDCSAGSGCGALKRDPEYTIKLMLRHPDRFVYARDGFTSELSEYVDTLNLPEDVRKLFYHGNILRLIGEV